MPANGGVLWPRAPHTPAAYLHLWASDRRPSNPVYRERIADQTVGTICHKPAQSRQTPV